jgi:hypothetical protein
MQCGTAWPRQTGAPAAAALPEALHGHGTSFCTLHATVDRLGARHKQKRCRISDQPKLDIIAAKRQLPKETNPGLTKHGIPSQHSQLCQKRPADA